MNVNVPEDLYETVAAAAKWYRISTEEAVRRALTAYVKSQREIEEELDAWQGARDEALRLVLGDEEEQW